MDKVLFNLKNAHYAKKIVSEEGAVTFTTPVPIPGSVSLALDAEGEVSKFYADGIVYYVCQSNNGYSGDFEVATIPEAMLIDIYGYTKDTAKGIIVENSNVQPAEFAFLFEVDGDTTGRKYVLYNCSTTRPGINANTTSDNKEPDTQKINITVSPLADGTIKAHTADDATDAQRKDWYKAVVLPTAALA